MQFIPTVTRRDMLRASACGMGQLALAAMAGQQSFAENAAGPHLPARAKRVIFLFMWGGPSHVDLFDPKPILQRLNGQPLAGKSVGIERDQLGNLLGSPFRFKQHGQSGTWMSELLPHLSTQADRMCVIRSMHTEGNAHGEALLRLHTGQANLVRPSVGAWVSYGLGYENSNLPAFITISPPRGHGGVQNYGNAFLPAVHQGTAIGSAEIEIAKATVSNLVNQRLAPDLQQKQFDLIQSINRRHLAKASDDKNINGLIANYELAFRMQTTMPPIMDLKDETKETLDLYGIGSQPTDNFGRQCLLARKFAENGVRYIQVSTNYTWDHHQKVEEGLIAETKKVDQPMAGLLKDLARRGLLDDTLVVWGAEFGRTPMAENGNGRNHHPRAFTMWMAGGGVRGGLTHGATDEFGFAPVEKPVHMHDLHATVLHALGLDHKRLTYRHAGRDFRLTDVYGEVVHDVFA
jgi:hypothetical protein